MTGRLPTLKARDIIRVLRFLGFSIIRIKGSHVFLKHTDGRTTLVPKHSGEDIGRGLFRQILRETNLSPEEFKKYL